MEAWTISQLKCYIIVHGGRVDDPHPMLKRRHYRLLLLASAERISKHLY